VEQSHPSVVLPNSKFVFAVVTLTFVLPVPLLDVLESSFFPLLPQEEILKGDTKTNIEITAADNKRFGFAMILLLLTLSNDINKTYGTAMSGEVKLH